jgi:beta-mannosidase
MDDYHNYVQWEGRFVSEFGLEACPALSTLEAFTEVSERYPQSRTLDHHNKSVDGPRRLAVYLNDNLCVNNTLEAYVYASQFVQAEALAQAYRGWRRRWQGPKRYGVAGALVWQLNDCWPAISWALVDYTRQPKPAYYVVRRELAPLTLGLHRLNPKQASVWLVNSSNNLPSVDVVRVELAIWTLEGVLVSQEQRYTKLTPNGSTELGEVKLSLEENHVLSATLFVGENLVACSSLWPEPFKYLKLPDPQLELKYLDAHTLQIQSLRPAKGVWLEVAATGQPPINWSDNMLDLMPNQPQLITVASSLHDQKIKIKWLGQTEVEEG